MREPETTCPVCHGDGYTIERIADSGEEFSDCFDRRKCDACDGYGTIVLDPPPPSEERTR